MSYQNKNQNCSINKGQNLRKKKINIQDSGYSSFSFKSKICREIFSQIYKDLYGDSMLLPIQISINMAAGNQQKYLSLSFATKA